MSKKIISLALSALMLMAMTIPASASVFTGSAENQPASTVVEASGTVGDVEVTSQSMEIVPMTDSVVSEEEQVIFDEAIESVYAVSDVQELVGDIDTMEEPAVATLVYIDFTDEVTEAIEASGDSVISITISTTIADDVEVLAYVYKNDEWTEVLCTNNGDGTITLTGHFCPVMLVVDAADLDSGDTDADEDDDVVTSPETNDIASVNYLAVFTFVFVVATASCLVSTKKSVK